MSKTKKSEQGEENLGVLESAENLSNQLVDVETYFEKNKKLFGAIGIAIAAIIAGVAFYMNHMKTQEEEAQKDSLKILQAEEEAKKGFWKGIFGAKEIKPLISMLSSSFILS
jgi:uncharacterized membrane-anchored protein